MHLRVLTYDRNTQTRGGQDSLVLAILYDAQDTASTKDARIQLYVFGEAAKAIQLVSGKQLKLVAVPWNGDQMAATLRQQRADFLYITAGLETHVEAIKKTATQLRTPTLTGSRALVASGFAVGVANSGGVKIYINRAAARSHGMRFDARVFKHAELVGE